ncbi:hypothetical protein Sm713_00190 [Streptomyces sp. TS71-3]|nr:hypothetical protein Sm713_00190 [Streptomyces sp. TS71-3]
MAQRLRHSRDLHVRHVSQQVRGIAQGEAVGKLEVNPSGQYGFIEQATGLPITAAICDYLEGTGP